MTLANASGVSSWELRKWPMPAMFSTMSRPSRSSTARSIDVRTASGSVTSHTIFISVSIGSVVRSTPTTVAPSEASRAATARPMPDPAPVTNTLDPANRFI